MKKVLLAIAIVLLFATDGFSVGTCTVGDPQRTKLINGNATAVMISVSCTADAAAATFPESTISNVGGFLMAVYFDPGATAPTNLMDMTVELGATNFDLMGGAAANITTSANANAIITPLVGAVSAPAGFAGDLTVTLTGNSVNSATLTYYLIIAP